MTTAAVVNPTPIPWKGPHPQLEQSPIHHQSTQRPPPFPKANPLVPIDNRAAFAWVLDAMRANFAAHDRWLLVVPGTSEVDCKGRDGHHVRYCPQTNQGEDPDVDVVSPEFRARIDHAHTLLKTNRVGVMLISGGSVDVTSENGASWCEALMGAKYLLARHAREWAAGELARRVIIDPWALHSECNVRNGQRVAVLLGLDRCTFLTTARDNVCRDQGRLFERMPMAFYTRRQYRKVIGYPIGEFTTAGTAHDAIWDTNGVFGVKYATRAYDSSGFPAEALVGDTRWAQTAAEG